MPDPGEGEDYELVKLKGENEHEIPEEGAALNFHTKKMNLKKFKKIRRKNETYLFTEEGKKFELLSKVSKKKELK